MVSCSAGAAGLAAAITGKKVFEYNRENYLYDRTQRQKFEYEVMECKIAKADLFREDIKNVVELTNVKMDTYLIVNAVQLGFAVMALCEGRLAAGTPSWLVGAHVLAMAGAFTFFLMSVLFAMHATVSSQSFRVRMMTQWVRLPVPSWAQIEGARTFGSTFEKVEPRQMFRVPFVMGKQEDLLNASKTRSGTAASTDLHAMRHETLTQDQVVFDDLADEEDCTPVQRKAKSMEIHGGSADPWGLEAPGDSIYELDATLQTDPRRLRHIQILREAMSYWQAYDGFARVAQSVGTGQLTRGMAYYVLGYVLISNHALVATYGAMILFLGIIWGLIRLDMSLTQIEYIIAVVLALAGPLLALPCCQVWAKDTESWIIPYLMPAAYVCESFWCFFLLYACKVRTYKNGVILPRGFRSVLYIDVFGWIRDSVNGTSAGPKLSTLMERPVEMQAPESLAGNGPAVQSTRYVNGEPVPTRIEQLPGASRQQYMDTLTKEDFATTTFVPRDKGNFHDEDWDGNDVEPNSGTRPWGVFRGATILLAVMWIVGSVGIALELWGLSNLEVIPLVLEPGKQLIFSGASAQKTSSLLQTGHLVTARWPHSDISPVGLACDSSTNTVVASTEFGLYVADLSKKKDDVQFARAPRCKHIRGEALQDVSLKCPSRSSCHAVVLHGGRHLARCDLDPIEQVHTKGVNHTSVDPSMMYISEDWLFQEPTIGRAAAETAQSLSVSSRCSGQASECAYVSTSGGRVAELHRAVDASDEWFPSRLLQFKTVGVSVASAGPLAVLHNRYLAALQHDRQYIHITDLQHDDSLIQPLQLPTLSGTSWKSFCATNDHLFLLTTGSSPQLWQFPVPQLHSSTAREARSDDSSDKFDVSLLDSHRSFSGKFRHHVNRWK